MAELIKKTDNLNDGREKLNAAITDAEQAKVVSGQADDKATEALAQSESTQTQLDTIVINGDSSVEAAQARVSTEGTAYSTLKQRLDAEYTGVTTQLAQRPTQDDLTNAVTPKAEKTYVDSKYNLLESEKIDRVTFDIASSSINFYANNSVVNSISIAEAGNSAKVQEYIDTLVRDGHIAGISLADKSVTEKKYADESITSTALGAEYRHRGLKVGEDVNLLIMDGTYTLSNPLNVPVSTSMLLKVERYGSRFYQVMRRLDNPTISWSRGGNVSSIASIPWTPEPILGANSISKVMLQAKSISNDKLDDNYDFNGTITSGNLNLMTKTGRWLLSGTNFENVPVANTSAYLTVKNYGNFITQTFTLFNDASQSYLRIIKADNTVHQDWVGSGKPLEGKIVVDFGDSIIGNTRGVNSVSNAIALRTGATVHNCGFGGCRMSRHDNWWDAFSMYRLAEAITSGDWSLQDQAIIDGSDESLNPGNKLPFYFESNLTLLKNLDFNAVDYINIEYATNDYTASKLVDNPDNPYDVDTYAGALRYSLEKIMQKYPHLKIAIWTPTYRFWLDAEGNFIEDSDTKKYNDQTLIGFVEKAKEVSKQYKIPCIDNYFELGINKFNKEHYFSGNDGTHPNPVGNKKIGHKVGSALISMF